MRKFVLQKNFTNYDTNSFKRYLTEIQNIKPLSFEEEKLLIAQMVGGDPTASDELVRRNLRFVISVAKQYITPNNSLEDLVNEGNYALLEAVKRFDPTTGFRFYSYAVWWIRRNMIVFTTNNKTIRLPHNKNFTLLKISRKMDEFEQQFGRSITEDELISLGFEEKDVKDFFLSENIETTSMDTDVATNGGEVMCPLSETIDSMSSHADENLIQSDTVYKINQLLKKIKKEKNRKIIIMIFGLNGMEAMPIQSIAEEMNMTSERIRQIKYSTLKELRVYSEILN